MSLSVGSAPARSSLAADLERIRLQERSRRMHAVVRELRARARFHAARRGHVPKPLRQAITTFGSELAGMQARIDELERGRRAPRATA